MDNEKQFANTPKAAWPYVVAMTVFFICAGLAQWQWQRGQAKQLLLEQIKMSEQLGVMPLSKFKQLSEKAQSQFPKVVIRGEVHSHYWLLDNQIYQGQVGYDLIVAVKLDDDANYWLVNLGWLAGDLNRQHVPKPILPAYLSTHTYVKSKPEIGFTLANSATSNTPQSHVVQYISPTEFASQLKLPIANVITYSISNEIAQPHYQPVVMTPDKHKAYALQWMLIGFAALVVTWVAVNKQRRDQ